MDALEVSMKLEKQFGITIGRFDWDRIHYHETPLDTTAGELHEWVTHLCAEQDVDVPPSSWHRVQAILVDVCNVSPRRVRRESWLKRDLGFC